MNQFLKQTNKMRIETVIKNLEKRGMSGYYCETKKEAADLALELLKTSKSVSWGGSASIAEIGLFDRLGEIDIEAFDPYAGGYGPNLESRRESLTKDAFLMSTNAITMDGIMLNIDGLGNRVAALCFGPESIIVVAGYNKIVADEEEAYKRVKNIACVANGIRIGTGTPCALTGKCTNCKMPSCMCASVVYTRFSRETGRIKVILVNEELGF